MTIQEAIDKLTDDGFDILEVDQKFNLEPSRSFRVWKSEPKIHTYMTAPELVRYAKDGSR